MKILSPLLLRLTLAGTLLVNFHSCQDKGVSDIQALPDYSDKLRLVMLGLKEGDYPRMQHYIDRSFRDCPIDFLLLYDQTLEGRNKRFVDSYSKFKNVESKPFDLNPDNYGAGFPRDNMPLPVLQKGKCKYLWGKPHKGDKMLDELIKKGLIKKEDVIRTPFQFDGGDIVIGKNCVFVTESFFTRDANKGTKRAELEKQLKKYLGVKCVVSLGVPAKFKDFAAHSDMLVRPLPCGKIVVAAPPVAGASEADKKTHQKNLEKVKKVYGEKNVVEIPSGLHDINSYANAVVVQKKDCCIVLVPQFLGGADEEPDEEYAKPDFEALKLYKKAVEGCKPKCIIMGVPSIDTFKSGGAAHCRTGNLFKAGCK